MGAAGFGVVLGVGLGFRQDLLIFVPTFVVALIMAGVATPMRTKWMAAGVAAAALVVALGPQLAAYAPGGGASVQHVATLGLMSEFDEPLGVTNDGLYEWGYYNEDSFASAIISGHGRRYLGIEEPIEVYGRAYDRSATSYWVQLVQTFPADLFVRAYGSVLRLVELPSSTAFTGIPAILSGTPVERVWQWRGRVLNATSGWWALATVAAIVVVACRSTRSAIGLAVLVVYTLAYPAVQFHERHYFYLDAIPVFAAAFVLHRAWHWREAIAVAPAIAARRVAVTAVTVAMLFWVPLVSARTVQSARVSHLLEQYEQSRTTGVAAEHRDDAHTAFSLASADDLTSLPQEGRTATDLYKLVLGGSSCRQLALSLTLRYQTSHANPNFTRTETVRLAQPPATTVAFVPGYSYRSPAREDGQAVWYRPLAFEVTDAEASCVVGVSRVDDVRSLPLIVASVLPGEWRQAPPYQTLTLWENRKHLTPTLAADPAVSVLPDLSAVTTLLSRGPTLADVAHVDGQQLSVHGRGGLGGRGQSFYLAELPDVAMSQGQQLVATGDLVSGGLSLGLVQQGRWVGQVAITRPGPFVALVAAPASGHYHVVLANNLQGRFEGNDFMLTHFGLVP